MKVKEESEKAGLKFNIKKTKIMAAGLTEDPLYVMICFSLAAA